MRISIYAVGRLKTGPERDLLERYLDRARKTGKPLALTDFDCREIPESRAQTSEQRKADEANQLIGMLPDGARLVVLDETGKQENSQAFATRLSDWRDDGCSSVVFAIGGADGHGRELRKRAHATLAFGQLTWPHQLVRMLLAEQLYRATTILSGHPYHRQ
ncbi:23S rRNA (pseudouridine(1915)-N(3))-methyltransferase RlmH [Coralliovum pocilloporae]|uniref:23S rRNA (pseudouridine(1915)-N(3))-methyltransferase RlmH n=1 Tax=Coralliovum pocilloporae TaxID=3066369 RepID=UPI0033074BCF